ncbi:MAG TPA: hypothetical protein VGT05_04780 [Patescibacteria group bacterium]|nr:hypothetical protein [Patescibacteria group bacterium]
MVTFDDFTKLEIKVGTIIEATKIPQGDRLLQLIFDFGDEKRQIMSAIAAFYPDPSVLVGKQIPVITNLETRTLKGHVSQGMIMATDDENSIVFLVPEKPVKNGVRVH